MKKLLITLICLISLFTFSACSNNSSNNNNQTENDDVFNVGVVQLVQHEALDAATQGFVDALIEEFGEDKVKIDVQVAAGEITNCSTIVNGFVANNVDLIMANATPALQAAAATTSDIPILGTSVTDYASALEVDNWNSVVGNNISGTSDLAPLDGQAAMIKELFPDAKSVGIIFCSSESNSAYQVEVISQELEKLGFEVKEFSFTDTNDITSVVQNACDNADVLFIPTDNTAAANTEAIANVVLPAKKAVVSGEDGIARGCGVATLSISYYDLGVATGKQAIRVLNGEDITSMPIEYASNFTKKFNPSNCNELGISVPEDYVSLDD